jgi:hypothetical protein
MLNLAFSFAVFIVAIVAGAVAAVSGFGIGSLLTPLLAAAVGMKVAVTAVSLPHFVATCARLWGLRKHVDRRVLLHFGILSAVGGLLGALLQSRSNSPILGVLFGCLLMLLVYPGWPAGQSKCISDAGRRGLLGHYQDSSAGSLGIKGGSAPRL